MNAKVQIPDPDSFPGSSVSCRLESMIWLSACFCHYSALVSRESEWNSYVWNLGILLSVFLDTLCRKRTLPHSFWECPRRINGARLPELVANIFFDREAGLLFYWFYAGWATRRLLGFPVVGWHLYLLGRGHIQRCSRTPPVLCLGDMWCQGLILLWFLKWSNPAF